MATKPPKIMRTDLESNLQARFIKWLRSKGCIVWKLEQSATTQAARPDCLFLYEGLWGVLEFKKSAKARFQPGQKQMLEKLGEWSYARVVYPENEAEIKREIEEML